MNEMGFTYVPSTAGSSVRFDPSDPKDRVCVRFSVDCDVADIHMLRTAHHIPQASVFCHLRLTMEAQPFSISIAHPDSTIHPVMLKEFGKRLRRTYGWSEEAFNF